MNLLWNPIRYFMETLVLVFGCDFGHSMVLQRRYLIGTTCRYPKEKATAKKERMSSVLQ
jgi:hypothetical protein